MELGRKLYIRSLVNVAGEPLSYFWPMRNFVYHNPLHELEGEHFSKAIKEGEEIFKGRAFLRRKDYIDFLNKGLIKEEKLLNSLKENVNLEGAPLTYEDLLRLIKDEKLKVYENTYLIREADTDLVEKLKGFFSENPKEVMENLFSEFGKKYTIADFVDLFFGESVNRTVNELLIKLSLDFLDEGQSVVEMPRRKEGFFRAFRELAKYNLRFIIRGGRELGELMESFEEPEEAIDNILKSYGIPEELWERYITLELAKLKGIAGYIKWRSHNKHYYFQRVYPSDLVEFLAVRLILEKGILEHRKKVYPFEPTYENFKRFFEEKIEEAFLTYEYATKRVPAELSSQVRENLKNAESFINTYLSRKAHINASNFALFLKDWLGERVKELSKEELKKVLEIYGEFQEKEGFIWLEALEDSLIERLTEGVLRANQEKEKPKAQALFCIDVRSERYRRNLEKIGNYETYGIAGFFGVPMAFVEIHKGHEEFLCPVLIKPRNVVLEIPKEMKEEYEVTHLLEHILHDLKQNVLTPYVTVEAIGFLFGFDFIGKTFMPYSYSKLKEKLLESKENVDYIINKPSREEVKELVNRVYETILKRVFEHEYGIKNPEKPLLEETLKVCLGETDYSERLELYGFKGEKQREFIERLRKVYKVDRGYWNILFERLSKLGFTLDEQASLIGRALKMVGLTEFAPFVFIIGHGSKSDNNPYESALDCGACGGASGLYNAIVFCRMANNPEVRKRIKEKFGINIPENTYFVPGLHNTTTDEVHFYDLEQFPQEVKEKLKEIKEDFDKASMLTASERYKELFDEEAEDELRKIYKVVENAYDWSQVRPEWGLSGNYAFVIGRRELTKHLNLEGKVFLHSYDYRVDRRGFLLEVILSGPAIVGQWINMEYYFSTTDNEVYGSGSKVYHNVVGRFGVISGNFSDLRTGLPTQTVYKEGKPLHIPARLIILLEAPYEFALSVINRVYAIRNLIQNEWVNFVIFDPESKKFYRYKKGSWNELKTEVKDG